MYTAHYQGTAQVAVIAGLAESSGPEEKSWGGARKHLRWSGNNPMPSSMLLPSWIPALTGLREDSRSYPL